MTVCRENALLRVEGLTARVEDKEILKGLDLEICPGEVHAIMGPNGSGKSTLAGVLAGRDAYAVTGGKVTFDGKDLLALAPEVRAAAGLFLGFQYPVEIPGVGNLYFLRTALNAVRRARGEEELDAMDFLSLAKEKMKLVELDPAFGSRSVNEGFSGGEKKRNEIFQMAVLEPKLAILDEIDSGLDIDALRVVARGVNALRRKDRGLLLVTHYKRLLEYIEPDHVHVMAAGRIVRSGGPELADELERTGYAWVADAPPEVRAAGGARP
jgi:Fe-S cluster assembly ATP-binding protein